MDSFSNAAPGGFRILLLKAAKGCEYLLTFFGCEFQQSIKDSV
jgi:hypothetical protein